MKEVNIFIYVWIHSDQKVEPYFSMIDGGEFCKDYANRGHTVHDIKCVMQDIPENGADLLHFKFVHKEFIPNVEKFNFVWYAKWKRGDDPDIKEIFYHEKK